MKTKPTGWKKEPKRHRTAYYKGKKIKWGNHSGQVKLGKIIGLKLQKDSNIHNPLSKKTAHGNNIEVSVYDDETSSWIKKGERHLWVHKPTGKYLIYISPDGSNADLGDGVGFKISKKTGKIEDAWGVTPGG
jgi:hypothetical protein